MNISFNKYILTLSLFFITGTSFSQVTKDPKPSETKDTKQDPPKGTITEEIEVVRPYKPILAEAVKLRRNPDLTNNKPYKPALTYNIEGKKLELNSDIAQLEAQKLAQVKADILKNNYAKIGAGNLNTGLGELYINNGKDPALTTGMFIKHLSQQGSLNKQQFSNQQASVFGRSIGEEVTIAGKLNYERNSTYFYGFDPKLPSPSIDPGKQRFNTMEAEGELMNNFSEDNTLVNYAAKFNGYYFNNISEGRETSAILSGYFNKALSKFHLGLGASIDLTATKDSLYDITNNLFKANPFVKFKGNGFLLNIGLNLVQEFGTVSKLNFLPAVSIEIPIALEYATLFGGVSGDVLKSNLREFSTLNPYVNNNLSIINSVERLNFYGGIKGNAGSGFGYKVMGYYKTVDNLPLFVNNSTSPQRFDVVYDEEAKISAIEGELSIKASDVISIYGKAQFTNYNLSTEQEAWFKPVIQLTSNAKAQINKKFSLDAEILFRDPTQAKVLSNISAAGPTIVSIKSFTDFSAGAEYRFNEKVGVFARANNIFNTAYQQYLYYPKLGLNVLGGFNYSF